ncbi:hypothetical protein EOD39_3913 [Acipenser ruthenus]|uniref:Uncharacterized protein n=1 Tax=Acipenser ruthenus TaxID=7906 RepID=A0A444UKI3_ACIRT|nr:hypothetical protein EOD39_3913 [Acipenser ruthenus]
MKIKGSTPNPPSGNSKVGILGRYKGRQSLQLALLNVTNKRKTTSKVITQALKRGQDAPKSGTFDPHSCATFREILTFALPCEVQSEFQERWMKEGIIPSGVEGPPTFVFLRIAACVSRGIF